MLLVQNTRKMNIDENVIKLTLLVIMVGACVLGFLNGFSKPFKCKHKNKVLRVIYSCINCETTATFCQDCAKQLTEAKTDCR